MSPVDPSIGLPESRGVGTQLSDAIGESRSTAANQELTERASSSLKLEMAIARAQDGGRVKDSGEISAML